ncbi:MAG: hypothetical protein ACQEVA_10150, partial [Myxococcota bacterium]
MVQLAEFFEGAEPVAPDRRRCGIEVETLFVREDGRPLMAAQGEAVFGAMEQRGWERRQDSKDL